MYVSPLPSRKKRGPRLVSVLAYGLAWLSVALAEYHCTENLKVQIRSVVSSFTVKPY